MANDDGAESAAAENEIEFMGKIQRPENENEFTIFGVRYVAEAAVGCERRCAFFEMMPSCRFLNRPQCSWMKRRDGRGVIFVRAEESAATQLALQDAEEALARTREERDKLREELAELRRANERLRNDVAYWRGDAEGQENLAGVMAKELDEVNENWGKRKRELEQLSRENAELAAQNVELREQIRELEHEKHCALLQSKANSQDAAHWKQTAEAMTKMFMDVEGELRELKAKAAGEEA